LSRSRSRSSSVLNQELSLPAKMLGTRGLDDCVCLFCVCVGLCVDKGLATGWSPVQGILPTVCRTKKLKKKKNTVKAQQWAVELLMIMMIIIVYPVTYLTCLSTYPFFLRFYLPCLFNCQYICPSTYVYSGCRHELSSPLQHWDRGFESYLGMDVCVCSVCVFFCFYVVSSETDSQPNKRLMRTYHWIRLFMSYIKSAN
jgi:hypothetical protein